MNSRVLLGVDGLELDWGRYTYSRDHRALFLPSDRVEIEYVADDGSSCELPAFVRPLRRMLPRLEMLGYTLDKCRRMYEDAADSWPGYLDPPPFDFDQFATIFRRIDPKAIRPLTALDDEYDLGELSAEVIFRDPEFVRVMNGEYEIRKQGAGEFLDSLDPYITLRLLAENPANLDLDVTWKLFETEEWIHGTSAARGIAEKRQENVCLVVTEGSTDSAILRESLPLVAPDVMDFFDFLDMAENYPFTGTGNLVRFAQGLARIRIQNRILMVLDNDCAGRDAFARISKLDLPPRMAVTLLPSLDEFREFPTCGPSGDGVEDINGRAVSIELFLELNPPPGPRVRWTSYHDTLGAYQGELINKTAYVRAFHDACRRQQPYNLEKLQVLWSHLLGATLAERESA